MSGSRAIYLDSSALVKLAIAEPESAALRRFLRSRPLRVSSAVARTEVIRAVRSAGPVDAGQLRGARHALASVDLLRVSDRILEAAGVIPPVDLRSLDAIHLATAEYLEGEVKAFVTYDERLAAAAAGRGMKVVQPR